jgi:hypothetical protein|tara:strand:+ start:537 stop:1145 length:609 start_codon:yes stop_codon:yes gene_type:complete
MTTSGFWTAKPTVDPVRKFLFRVLINNEFAWWAKTCDKPKINIPVLAKDEYYLGSALPDTRPGEIADFQPITMTFIDPSEWGLSLIVGLHISSGGEFGVPSVTDFPRLAGAKLKEKFGNVMIEQVDSAGEPTERWTLNGAFPTSIDFGSLDYGSSEFVEITVTWEYTSFHYDSGEYAVLTSQAPQPTPTSIDEAKKLDGSYT